MRARHGDKVDWLACFFTAQLAIPLIVPETVLHADDNPKPESAPESLISKAERIMYMPNLLKTSILTTGL